MSTYLSYRRRYSAPEKPEPRFQWRLRVHSLMMDDSDNTATLSERRAQRRDSSGAYRFNYETRQDDREAEPNHQAGTTEMHRARRERFTRTKSEGHLKLRVRFSKFSDASKSSENDDEDESGMCAEPESRKYRSSQESGIDSFGDRPTDEDDDRSEKRQDNAIPQFDDSVDDGFVCEESSEASADNGAAGRSEGFNCDQKCENDEKDISKGAIPKRYPNISKLDLSNQWEDDGEQGLCSVTNHNCSVAAEQRSVAAEQRSVAAEQRSVAAEQRSVAAEQRSVAAEQRLAKDREHSLSISEKIEPSESCTLEEECDRHAVQSSAVLDAVSRRTGDDDYDYGAKKSHERLRADSTYEDVNRSTENTDNLDDIESIIERIIAEEEATLVGKTINPTELSEMVGSLNDQGIKTMMSEIKKLKDDNENEKDDDTNGISIARSISQDKHRSSSLPSYQCDEVHDLAHSVIPFSSSCPSSKKELPKSNNAKAEEEDDEELEDDGWAFLPVILLEDVFTHLSPKERHQASQVCRQWFDLFYSPRVWETFILLERTLTKKRFNLYKGYQRELCPGKTQLCFRRVGSFFKKIVVTPITDYFNLYEFLRILAAFLQYQEDHGLAAMPLLHTFDFTFACASRGDGGVIVHGTGGQILEMIKQLLIRISNLKHLKLNQLLIDDMDVPGLFDAMANCFGECLNSLEMLNVTKVPFGLTDLARFRNLVKLSVSPQHLNEEVLLLIAGLNLLQLHLLQDPYTCECEPVSYEAWKLVREMAPWLRVFLEVCGNTRAHVLIQPRAPVYGVFLRTPYSRLTSDLVMSLVEHYSNTLHYFVQEHLPRVHGPRGIDVRCDSSLLFLVRRCQALHTLVIRERISTSTLILIANEGKKLLTLLVRRHGLIKRCDWPQPGAWTKEFYSRLKDYSLDYEKCTDEVCTLLRQRWRPLTDKQFMRLKIIPRVEVLKWR